MNYFDAIQSFDIEILDRLGDVCRNSFGDGFWKVVTLLGDKGIFWIALAAVLLLFRRTRKGGLAVGIAILTGFLVGNLVLKNWIARIRPYDVNTWYMLTVKRLSDFSFPSGHTMASLGGSLALFYVNKKYGTPAVIMAVMIMFSRLYLYVHYPSDILGGIVIALFTSLFGFVAAELIMQRFEPWFENKIDGLKAKKASEKGLRK